MKSYTPWQYLLIDVANQMGLDKLPFEERIEWAETHLTTLEEEGEKKTGKWKERPLYIKSVSAVRKAQRNQPSGHIIHMDAICSGMQIMSAMMSCEQGAKATGLIDQDRRADAYTDCTQIMQGKLGAELQEVDREDVKQAVMTALYGSKEEPKKVFGDETDELNAFYESMGELCPGAVELLNMLVASWQPHALSHEWVLPDGFCAKVKVIEMVKTQIEVDELDSHTFTYQYAINKGTKKGVKNAANVVHSVDSYILRSMLRRCNYDPVRAKFVYNAITDEIVERQLGNRVELSVYPDKETEYYAQNYERSGVVDAVILPYLDVISIHSLSDWHLADLRFMLDTMLQHEPFEIVTIHDSYGSHANNVNQVRVHYAAILADIAESKLVDDLMAQMYGYEDTVLRINPGVGATIRAANYALT